MRTYIGYEKPAWSHDGTAVIKSESLKTTLEPADVSERTKGDDVKAEENKLIKIR